MKNTLSHTSFLSGKCLTNLVSMMVSRQISMPFLMKMPFKLSTNSKSPETSNSESSYAYVMNYKCLCPLSLAKQNAGLLYSQVEPFVEHLGGIPHGSVFQGQDIDFGRPQQDAGVAVHNNRAYQGQPVHVQRVLQFVQVGVDIFRCVCERWFDTAQELKYLPSSIRPAITNTPQYPYLHQCVPEISSNFSSRRRRPESRLSLPRC